MTKTALVIAGHGSHISAQTAAPAWQHADAIRMMGVFDEVTCAFWKESPSLRRVLDTLTAEDITIVPLFTSQGYFTRTVLPTELQLDGAITHRNGRIIRYANTVGSHPHMTDVVRQRALSVVEQYGLDPKQTALAIAGHGTQRDPESAAATAKQAEIFRAEGQFAEVVAIYMEEPPEVGSVYEITKSESIIVVPFFVADGPHTQQDIPKYLRLTTSPKGFNIPSTISGRTVYYTSAIGMEPSVADVILELAYEIGTPQRPHQIVEDVWAGFPEAGLGELRLLNFPSVGSLHWGELNLEKNGGEFTVSQYRDNRWGRIRERRIDSPAELRDCIRYDDQGRFRALHTAPLPRNWYVQVNTYEALLAVIETIYPSAWIDYVQFKNGILPMQSLDQVVARQTGIYKELANLPPALQSELVDSQCEQLCWRHPTWYKSMDWFLIGSAPDVKIPCPEPCQCWMSFALQQLEAEHKKKVIFEFTADELNTIIATLGRIYHAYHLAEISGLKRVLPNDYDQSLNPARIAILLERLKKRRDQLKSDNDE